MAITYLKRAAPTPPADLRQTRDTVAAMLDEIEAGGEAAARAHGRRLDGFDGNVVVPRTAIEAAGAGLPQSLKDDIRFAHGRVRRFAERQRESLQPFEMELSPGVWAGQRLIPVETAGCYVPGGRYAHIASAIMGITTAKVAGVETVVACSAPHAEHGGIHPAILYTMDLCGADHVLAMGGVQGVAALTFGLFTGRPARIVVGPGNRFVAEAKRQLFGRVGIDLIAGPTEILVLADDSADPEVVATDLMSQAEHGPDSPVWLVSTSRAVAQQVVARMPALIATLPETQSAAATAAWRDCGEVVLCDTPEEMAQLSDDYAAEHLEIHVADPDWYVARLRNYGSLFIGEETTVTFGDKCSGTNHILPTRGAAHYTGGLSVHKFIKVVTTQRMTRDGADEVAHVATRISRAEGMEGHARAGDIRLAKYGLG